MPAIARWAISQITKKRLNIAPMFHTTAMKLSFVGQQ
jgi:hypothetical protein